MKTKLLSQFTFASLACLGLALSPIACGNDTTDAGMEGAEESGTAADGDGDAETSDTADTTGDGDGDTGDGDGDTTGDGDGDTTGDGDGDTGVDPLPNGSPCTSDAECESENCYVIPVLGGQCGECNEDADCPDGGCSIHNPGENVGSTCNMGELGGGCETSEVCMEGLVCGTVLDLTLFALDTCGECATDDDCTDSQICAPVVDVMGFQGNTACIDPGTVAQDDYCDLQGNGNEACESGFCSEVDIEGFVQVGSCGECLVDADCGANMTCQPGEFDLDAFSLIGSTCI